MCGELDEHDVKVITSADRAGHTNPEWTHVSKNNFGVLGGKENESFQ